MKVNISSAVTSVAHQVLGVLKNIFTLDIRSLAVLRIGIAVVVLFDVLARALYLEAHYTDLGVIPRDILLQSNQYFWRVSLYFFSGNPYVVGALFVATVVVAIFFLFGYKTRISTVVLWILILSMQNRNFMLNNGGDAVLRLLLFWGMFLPLGAAFSIDSRRRINGNQVFSMGTIAFILQVISIFIFSALLKDTIEWRSDFTAIQKALSLSQYASAEASILLKFPEVLKLMTWTVWHIELIAPFMLIFPYYSKYLRIIIPCILIAMLFSFGIFLKIGFFPFITSIALLAFFPPEFWRLITKKRLVTKAYREGGLLHRVQAIVASCLIVSVLLWNLNTLRNVKLPFLIYTIPLMYTLDLDQSWIMFSRFHTKNKWWVVVSGVTSDGRKLDLLRNGKVAVYTKPESIASEYKSKEWQKYFNYLVLPHYFRYRRPYLDYSCRNWNYYHKGRDSIDIVRLEYMTELQNPIILGQIVCR